MIVPSCSSTGSPAATLAEATTTTITTTPESTTATTATTATSTTTATTATSTTGSAPSTTEAKALDITPLTPGTSWQWQLSGTVDETVLDGVSNTKKMYDVDLVAADVALIDRLHAKGITVICYMETGGWESYRPDAAQYPDDVLGEGVDGYPDERFVDIRRADVLLPILEARLDLAVSKGCDGIEPDLDDTYNGYVTGFPLTQDDQLSFNRAVADAAHARGLSIGLKNGASADGSFERAMVAFTDWALNEECNAFDECAGYEVYIEQGKAVFQVEYVNPDGTEVNDFCPADNAANFDGLLKGSSDSLGALPRVACRFE